MQKIGIFLPDQYSSAVATTLYDYLLTANAVSSTPHFEPKFLSLSPNPTSYTGITLNAETNFPSDLDVLIVVGVGGGSKEQVLSNLESQSEAVAKVIRKAKFSGALIASTCTSAFFLAQTGQLKNKIATTAWWLLPELREKFPQVRWNERTSLSVQGRWITTGAGFSGVELARLLLGRLKKSKIESKVHRILLLPENPAEQKIYVPLTQSPVSEFATQITKLLQNNWQEADPVKLASQMGMSSRTFIRRFKEQMKMTPGRWLQLQRIEKAKSILSEQNLSIEETCHQVGYEDQSSFTRLFQREVGLTPSEFRMAFRGGITVSKRESK